MTRMGILDFQRLSFRRSKRYISSTCCFVRYSTEQLPITKRQDTVPDVNLDRLSLSNVDTQSGVNSTKHLTLIVPYRSVDSVVFDLVKVGDLHEMTLVAHDAFTPEGSFHICLR